MSAPAGPTQEHRKWCVPRKTAPERRNETFDLSNDAPIPLVEPDFFAVTAQPSLTRGLATKLLARQVVAATLFYYIVCKLQKGLAAKVPGEAIAVTPYQRSRSIP